MITETMAVDEIVDSEREEVMYCPVCESSINIVIDCHDYRKCSSYWGMDWGYDAKCECGCVATFPCPFPI